MGAIASPQEAQAFAISLNTSPLAGVSGRLEFVLLDGDPTAFNTVVISNIFSDGTFIGADCSIGCSGGPLSFVIDDTVGFGQLLYDLALGTALSFDLSYTTNYNGVPGTDPPDRLAVSLLDANTNFSLVDTELKFPDDALLTIDLIGTGVVEVARNVSPRVTVAIPEPGSLALTAIALMALVGRRSAAALRAATPG